MSDTKQEILFATAGLDTDSAQPYIELGDAPYRLNIVQGVEGSNGFIENMKGNRLAGEYPLDLSNTYQVVVSYYSQLKRKAYFFVFSQPYDWSGSGDYQYDNHLLVFDEDLETITNVFTDTKNYFGLHLHYPVKDCDMIGDVLYFNTRISDPKMINVVMAQNYTDYETWQPSPTTYAYGQNVKYFGGVFKAKENISADMSPTEYPLKWDRIGDTYQDESSIEFDSEFRYAFNVIRQIPVHRPICTFGTDTDKNANNIRGKVFRFSQRYKYYDGTYSLYGAYSDITLGINDEYYNGEVPGDIDLYNYINVFISLHSAALIKEIDIIFQEIGGDWKLAKTINRREQAMLDDFTYVYKFYNNEAYELINTDADTSNFYEIYDSVPQTAATQELINKNILSYGGSTEGFDNIDKNDIQVSLTPEIEEIDIDSVASVVRRDNLTKGDLDWIGTYAPDTHDWVYVNDFTKWYAGSGIAEDDIFSFTLNGVNVSYVIQAADIFDLATFIGVIDGVLAAAFPSLGIFSDATEIRIWQGYVNITQSFFYEPEVATTLTKKKGFKTGAWHPFCLFYYDNAMRRWDAQTSKENEGIPLSLQVDGTSVYVPMLNEYSPLLANTAYKYNIDWEVNHLPPEGAKWWRWGYAGNSLASYFVQYTISTIVDEAPWTKLEISPLQTLKFTTTYTNQFPQSNISPYQWTKGDRVRIITEASTALTMGALVDGAYDFEIVKYDDTTVEGEYWIYVQDFDYAALSIGEDSLIEIYTPIKTDTKRQYYEFGELMPIIEDGNGILVHGAGTTGTTDQDYSLSQPASGTFNAGDVYHILRTPSKAINGATGYFHESQWYSDFYDSDDFDRGRVGVETTFGKRFLNIIRYSNQYLQDTEINGLSTFEALHYKELSDIYGNIVAMMEVGTTLKVYMEKKSASILIGRQEYVDTEGNTTVATSSVVLGAVRYPENNYGTQWIESVSKNNRYVYGYDMYNSIFWRDSANGLFPISGRNQEAGAGNGDYKMESYFKAKSDALALSGIDNVKVFSVWDEKYKLLYVIFKDQANNANNETIVYHEPSNRWICFTDFNHTPANGYNEMLELDYSVVTGFEGGFSYIFNEDTRFAEFDFVTNASAFTSLSVGTLQILAYDPTITIDVTTPELDLNTLTIYAFDPTVTVVDGVPPLPTLTLVSIESIPDGTEYTTISVNLHYNNSSTAVTEWVDIRIKDHLGNTVLTTSSSENFAGSMVNGVVVVDTASYPEFVAGETYTMEIKLQTGAWVDAVVSDVFESIAEIVPMVTLTSIDIIPSGVYGTAMPVTVHYDNTGDATTMLFDYEIWDWNSEFVSTGSSSFAISGNVINATFALSVEDFGPISYPPDSGMNYYTLRVKKSTDDWSVYVSQIFQSTT